MDILHNEPFNSLLVFGVNSGGLDELGLEPYDGLRLVVCIEMHGECVDHFRKSSDCSNESKLEDVDDVELRVAYFKRA